eukprot:TRINITY_DN2625_c0_g1_i13.p1 TRINITY_DN2625_c0_g1~~TRINITY_DN2625_c0_g1_i13.p1  ORF type:complete len:309 (+),score=9.86 TRINITY_DN2625_c0_g1_i13:127-1053(+)
MGKENFLKDKHLRLRDPRQPVNMSTSVLTRSPLPEQQTSPFRNISSPRKHLNHNLLTPQLRPIRQMPAELPNDLELPPCSLNDDPSSSRLRFYSLPVNITAREPTPEFKGFLLGGESLKNHGPSAERSFTLEEAATEPRVQPKSSKYLELDPEVIVKEVDVDVSEVSTEDVSRVRSRATSIFEHISNKTNTRKTSCVQSQWRSRQLELYVTTTHRARTHTHALLLLEGLDQSAGALVLLDQVKNNSIPPSYLNQHVCSHEYPFIYALYFCRQALFVFFQPEFCSTNVYLVKIPRKKNPELASSFFPGS